MDVPVPSIRRVPNDPVGHITLLVPRRQTVVYPYRKSSDVADEGILEQLTNDPGKLVNSLHIIPCKGINAAGAQLRPDGCHRNARSYSKRTVISPGQLFEDWADQTLFPEIERRRQIYGYTGTAVLILDGYTVQTGDCFLNEYTFRNVCPFILPPHPSDQLQLLDLVLFGHLKGSEFRRAAQIVQFSSFGSPESIAPRFECM